MKLKNWELIFSPSDTDDSRWRLKLKIGEDDLLSLLDYLAVKQGRPFILEDNNFDFGLYLYEINIKNFNTLTDTLIRECPKGKVVEAPKAASASAPPGPKKEGGKKAGAAANLRTQHKISSLWQLSHSPSNSDKNRWCLKLKISKNELSPLLEHLPAKKDEPIPLSKDNYNFSVNLLEVKPGEFEKITKFLKEEYLEGEVIGSAPEYGLDLVLEKVAESIESAPALNKEKKIENNKSQRVDDTVIPENNPVGPQDKSAAPEPEPVVPEPQEVVPVPELVIPAPEKVVPESQPIIPEPQQVVSEPEPIVSEPEPVRENTGPGSMHVLPGTIFGEPIIDLLKKSDEPPVPEQSDNALILPVPEKAAEAPSQPPPQAKAPEAEKSAKPDGFDDLGLNPRYTFEEFVIGPNNRFTAAAAQAVADNTGKIYNPFFIYSGVGLGKTHMMHAVGHYVRAKNPNLRILYVTTEKFMGDVINAIRRGSLQQLREHYRQIDLLLVDDIQFLVESESTQEEFFHIFNILHQSGKQIIITSDRPPKQLVTLEDRLRSRFEWGLIADIKSPNLETRVAILKKKGEVDNLDLSDNILLYIASKLKSNIRELEGFLKRINAYASLTHQEVNMDLVRTIMSDLLPPEEFEDPQDQPMPERTPPTFAEPAKHAPSPVPPVEPQKPVEDVIVEEDVVIAPVQIKPPSMIPSFVASANKTMSESMEGNMKAVEVGFFFPEGKQEELVVVKERFREVIKKHKLKFRLEGVFEYAFVHSEKINYAIFPEQCKAKKVKIAVVLGPPPESAANIEDFSNLLGTLMDDERLSLQLVQWAELNKDYRYLNLALDITLSKYNL